MHSPAPQIKTVESDLIGCMFSQPLTRHEKGSQNTPSGIAISSGRG